MTLVYSYPLMIHRVVDEDFCNGFLNWLMFQREDSPEKEFILANRTDLYSLLSRGRHTNDPNQGYLYHNLLPPELADTVKRLIKRGDQHAADLFDQLMSNEIISDWFSHDHRNGGFDQSIHETIKAGQTKVFFKDSIFGILRSDDHSELAANCVRNDRVDILNECLTKLQGLEQYTFYVSTVREITKLASEENDPGYVIKLAKDLITENLQLVRTSPIVVYNLVWSIPDHPSELRFELLNHILRSEKNPQLTSLLEFMLAEYQLAGIVIETEEALERAALYHNHEYDKFFLDDLPD
ncbi:hypothetical protein MHU86_19667 [Fragilaria crotonensis]|nr:hypothetical protein MHU86_19667 [Fragilaria crotonensis]